MAWLDRARLIWERLRPGFRWPLPSIGCPTRRAIVRVALRQFRTMLTTSANDPANNFVLADTQGTRVAREWARSPTRSPAALQRSWTFTSEPSVPSVKLSRPNSEQVAEGVSCQCRRNNLILLALFKICASFLHTILRIYSP